jgi:hypothetical protein
MVMPSEKYFRFRVPPELEQKLEEFFARTKLARVNVGELLLTYFLTEHENAQFEILLKGIEFSYPFFNTLSTASKVVPVSSFDTVCSLLFKNLTTRGLSRSNLILAALT